MKKLIQIFALVGFLISCQKDRNFVSYAQLGVPFQLKYNSCINFYAPTTMVGKTETSIVKVCFKGEVNDGRCHKSWCYLCYGSFADIQLEVIFDNNDTLNIPLRTIGCVNEVGINDMDLVDTVGHRFQFLKLAPYPDQIPIPTADYEAKLIISEL